ncbi:Bromodomain-containing factor [Lachnellula subtilissima]|uniref:Bromodomain-containing factor n=1 Tax=Lachnellula subtilissima TaxID=602034 RepID=A0A8H8S1Z3_9HELO|nr:Bromodomain-containing factor [Lachnellula subtilissima]
MTTAQPEGVAIEQKIQPVPSSDKMALDLDINGNSNRDETHNHVDATPPEDVFSKPADLDSTTDNVEASATSTTVNGFANTEAFTDNQYVEAPSIDKQSPAAAESQPTEEMSSLALNSQLPSTNTAAIEELQPSTSPHAQEHNTFELLASAESAIESAVDDVAAPSTVPPVVEAQESDLRHISSPPMQAREPPLLEQQSGLDFDFDAPVDLPQGMDSVDQSLGADVSNLDTSGNIPDLPDFSADSQLLQDAPGDFASDDILPLRTGNDATFEQEDISMSENGADNIKAETVAPAPVADVSMPPPKVAREREDDDESQPSAKRAKTDETTVLDQEMADVPPAPNGESAAVQADVKPISDYEMRETVKILKNSAKSKDGRNFVKPVAEMWPLLAESYTAKIQNPVDLATMEQRLKSFAYPNLDAVKDDAKLIASNAAEFNGHAHVVAASARVVEPEPTPAPKKEKVKKEPAVAAAPRTAHRRLSKGAGASAVKASAPAQTFALDPTTSTPTIRREFSGESSRPKREIHPPKNKDLPYNTATRPKNKKFATELKFCQEVLKELQDPKHYSFASAFYVPVDPVALGIPNYFAVIRSPMDLSTVEKKLKEGNYGNAKDFEKDIRQIVTNCYKFNPPGNAVRVLGQQFEEFFNQQWDKKQQYLADHSPAPASHAGSPDSEEEESEDDEDEAESAPAGSNMSAAAQRLIEEQGKLIEMMRDKKTSKDMIDLQHQLIDLLSKQVKDNPSQPRPAAKKAKKPSRPSKSKKPIPLKKAPAPKKAGGNRQHAKYMGTLEKEVISAGIGSLPEELSSQVLEMIKAEQPGVDVSYPKLPVIPVGDDGTLELDIDVVSVPTLWKIHGLIMIHCPEVDADMRKQFEARDTPRELAKPPTKKKNKPMSKSEQEQKIELLKSREREFANRQGSGSQEPVMPTVEAQDPESSGDEDSDSEEE